ncbi:hypothetical protein Trco_004062 [Trichoderma cornu-damae]|uniref:Uncharacterized protein n=1 Tax=Trichoderma cornu-damae TaxID=654480 RepID=A0A9P8TXW3_9HYPO|nr:hypothetical protein Trco_004062 [Trichoderma cornu-damae]
MVISLSTWAFWSWVWNGNSHRSTFSSFRLRERASPLAHRPRCGQGVMNTNLSSGKSGRSAPVPLLMVHSSRKMNCLLMILGSAV